MLLMNGLKALLRGENVIFKAVIHPNDDSALQIQQRNKLQRTPHWNLAVEDFILRYLNDAAKMKGAEGNFELGSALFLYNSETPCIVLGRNQNTFAETSLQKLAHLDREILSSSAPLVVRRRSGGGCVYHDSGCLCFSFIGDRKYYNPCENLKVIESAVHQSFNKIFFSSSRRLTRTSAKIHTTIGPRHDLFLNGKKITGSAMRMLQGSAYHHGTVLVTSDIANVSRYLKPLKFQNDAVSVLTKGTPSVRSPVTTLAAEGRACSNAVISDGEIFQHVIESIRQSFEVNETTSKGRTLCHVVDLLEDGGAELKDISGRIEQGINEISQWNWTFGENPEFTISILHDSNVPPFTITGRRTVARLVALGLKKVVISVKHGRITSFEMESRDRPCEQGLLEAIHGYLNGRPFRRECILAESTKPLNESEIMMSNKTQTYDKEGKDNFTCLLELICDACNL
ncbi:Lipoyltransferase and lipoate-protein ligase [Perkinsela sp. CCAP 1560/4]|nr:Lipoyltransferase and lipoate-protein ligase [Perkinsela sp. CCAP 1560/4]|eukprot:KNH09403.1 Lipoyltransferase and lipoate-protein ligase [Perkinsela sp. CCAP 1560/4]